ncbi:MAG: hypothetical protein R6W77_01725 [Trueperaceae bacterium]
MKRRLGIAFAALFVLVGCSTQLAPEAGVLYVDVTPDDAHVTITNELEAVDYGYGDVLLTGLEPGTYWIYAGRDGQMVEAIVEVTARWRVMAQIEVGAQERTRVTYHEHASNGPFDWDGRTIAIAKGPGGPGGGGGGGGGGGKKGGDYGDLWIILRDADGAPVLDENGCMQPITSDGTILSLVPADDGPAPKCEPAPGDVDLVEEVDFGRLNMVRSPPKVIEKAFNAAMATLNASEEPIVTDPAGRLVAVIGGVEKTIDSPLENLALYKFMLTALANGEPWPPAGATFVMPRDDLEVAAALFAAGSDKTGHVDLDEVIYINGFLGLNELDGEPYYGHYEDFNYGRQERYEGERAYVLVLDGGVFVPKWVILLELEQDLFDGDGTGGNALGFAQAVDDALHIIEYIHTYAVP